MATKKTVAAKKSAAKKPIIKKETTKENVKKEISKEVENLEVEMLEEEQKENSTKKVVIIFIVLAVIAGIFIASEMLRETSGDKNTTATPLTSNPLLTEEIPENQRKNLTEVTYGEFEKLLNEQKLFSLW